MSCTSIFENVFGSPDHGKLVEVLQFLGYSRDIVRMVADLYSGDGDDPMKVKVRTDFGETEQFPVRRGTIQGDTLSPLLFIVYLDPLLRWLNQGGLGYKMATSSITVSSPAFADDLALLVGRIGVDGMRVQLSKVLRYSRWGGLRLNVPKCAISGINTSGGSGKELYRSIIVEGASIPYLSPSSPYKYLGVWLMPDFKMRNP